MTEGHESDYLVTVRAQVMTRDESTEGWLPLAGGGLANVSIRKRARLSPGAVGHEYIIYGERISDQDIILSCVINRDLKYYKVMPTFHHWRAGKQRNGLTFQTAADARAFDKGIIRAYTEIVDGLAKSNPSIICQPLQKYDSIGEDDVFMVLDLPVDSEVIKKMPSSSPEGSEKSQKSLTDRGERLKDTSSNKSHIENPTIHYISTETSDIQQHPAASSNTNISISTIEQQPTIAPSENYSYVILTAKHDYNYPVVDQPAAAQVLNARRESISALKKRNELEATQAIHTQSSPISAGTLKDPARVEIIRKNPNSFCQHCRQHYSDERNRKGACEHAPDYFRDSLEYISCMKYARGMVFHCMKDSDSENPCVCASEPGCTKRWIGLTLLSLILPCLWCYPPLHACHSIGVSCGVCGGKHEPEV